MDLAHRRSRTAVHSVSLHFFQLTTITQCIKHTVTHQGDIRSNTDEFLFSYARIECADNQVVMMSNLNLTIFYSCRVFMYCW